MEDSKVIIREIPVARHTVYDSMYTDNDWLRISGETLLLRRIDKERRLSQRLQEQNTIHPSSADNRRKQVNND